jgi:hypothetical protein
MKICDLTLHIADERDRFTEIAPARRGTGTT